MTDRTLGGAIFLAVGVSMLILLYSYINDSEIFLPSRFWASWGVHLKIALVISAVGSSFMAIWMFIYVANKDAKDWFPYILLLALLNVIGLMIYFYAVYLRNIEEK